MTPYVRLTIFVYQENPECLSSGFPLVDTWSAVVVLNTWIGILCDSSSKGSVV
jgi:hypothetical protein